ncbi:MAG: TfoX/Sxy family protein [Hydrogenophaga sp.]|uniref:TfoX/Sxy family protein n=1 Tax=Comamonadaceae TaxID=80864 RepID=UPI002721D206|nr:MULTISPECIES: TfoX/Sxy family protein [Comamonadaceae]MDO9482449.1 TfoX/Sxy family protein [Hydrogenophaga sp.]MDP3346073.1 TfoX/Sxy family protein [Hydrogenophaga sp.]MDP3799350.1 TfoX/Sxy family protein [Polaromonas sp.]
MPAPPMHVQLKLVNYVKKVNEFVEHLSEVFHLFGLIQAKSMFGGYGIYHQDLMFGLVADNTLYLKTDAESAPYFSAVGSLPFEYTKNGVTMKMSYFSAPIEVFDEPEMARLWACRAYEAALRSKNKTAKRSK